MTPYHGAHPLGPYCNITSPRVHQLPYTSFSTICSSPWAVAPHPQGLLLLAFSTCCSLLQATFTAALWAPSQSSCGDLHHSAEGQPAVPPWTSPELQETYFPHLVYLLPSLCSDLGGCMSLSLIVFYPFPPAAVVWQFLPFFRLLSQRHSQC